MKTCMHENAFFPPHTVLLQFILYYIDYSFFFFKVLGSSLNDQVLKRDNMSWCWSFLFIILMGPLNLEHYLLGNSGKFSCIMSFITSFLYFLYLLNWFFILIILPIFPFFSFLFLVCLLGGVPEFILYLFYWSFYFCFHYLNSYKIFCYICIFKT